VSKDLPSFRMLLSSKPSYGLYSLLVKPSATLQPTLCGPSTSFLDLVSDDHTSTPEEPHSLSVSFSSAQQL
jgi:hypothetical protein